jgi:hypothetical protein
MKNLMRSRSGTAQSRSVKNSPKNKRPRRKQRGIVTLFLTFHAPQGAGNLPVILLNLSSIVAVLENVKIILISTAI